MKAYRFCIVWCLALLLVSHLAFSAAAQEKGFKKVRGPCQLDFPSDHGPHPGYRTEWWYYTGNLTDGDGRRFGFQLTFFRSALAPPEDRNHWPAPPSAWRTDQVYLAHFAISDIDGGRHLQAERMARPALSLAGADQSGNSVSIRTYDWQTVISPDGHRLRASTDTFALALDLTPDKPLVLHGENGYSRKGASPEQASCYYSFTRLSATGALTVDGSPHAVRGSAWMDHEFSTAPLQPGITGWDWFSLQLSDRTEVMFFLLRQADGSLHPASSGTFITPAGLTRNLKREDVNIRPIVYWDSPHSGARYPVEWRVTVDPLGLTLSVKANLADQEMRTPQSTGVVYWEGSVAVQGTRDDSALDGVGYVELTGYAEPFDAPM